MSLRTRLTIGSVCTLALAICAGLAAAYLVVRGQLRSEIDHSLERRADALVAIAQQAPPPPEGGKENARGSEAPVWLESLDRLFAKRTPRSKAAGPTSGRLIKREFPNPGVGN